MRMRFIRGIVDHAPSRKNADNAFFRVEAFLHMIRMPSFRQRFLILRKTIIVVIAVVSYIPQVCFASDGTAEILGYKRPCSSDNGIGLIKWAKGAQPAIHVYLFSYRPVSDHHPGYGCRGTE